MAYILISRILTLHETHTYFHLHNGHEQTITHLAQHTERTVPFVVSLVVVLAQSRVQGVKGHSEKHSGLSLLVPGVGLIKQKKEIRR